MQTRLFIGMDVHKATISISIAEDGRNGPVRFLGVIPNAPEDIAQMAKRLSRHGELDFCYEAGRCGNGIYLALLHGSSQGRVPPLFPVDLRSDVLTAHGVRTSRF
jgi:hypothetical protein